ncbi:MAG: glycosyltransferase [Candidatus Omnitrophota bacterium]|nr:glycosyltransferase [Candidatus Omnitrophota bacterium]
MKALILHARAGHGHLKVAEVLRDALIAEGASPEEIRLEDALERTPAIFRHTYPSIYFNAVKYAPALWGGFYYLLEHEFLYRCVEPFRGLHNRLWGGRLLRDVREMNPEWLIFTHFYSAELFARAKRAGLITSKLMTIVTDFHPHRVWINPGTDYYWVMSNEGRTTLEARGVRRSQILADGIPVDPKFMRTGQKKEILKKWGFEDSRFTLLITSGSFGLGPNEELLAELDAFRDKIQCFVVCGNNRDMEAKLMGKKYRFPVKILGFVDFMADLMEASDLLLAKCGGSTTVESLAKGIPMVVLQPIPGQETENAKLLKERNASFFLQKPEQIRVIMKTIFEEAHLMETKRARIQELARPHAGGAAAKFILGKNAS